MPCRVPYHFIACHGNVLTHCRGRQCVKKTYLKTQKQSSEIWKVDIDITFSEISSLEIIKKSSCPVSIHTCLPTIIPISVPRNLTNSNNKKTSQTSKKQISKPSKQCSSESDKKEKSLIEHFDKEIQLGEKTKVAEPPAGVEDFDKVTWDDPLQVSCYAMHIFEYLKSREVNLSNKINRLLFLFLL